MREIMCQTGIECVNQEDSTLSKLSTLLLEDITNNKIVRERLLLDFSKQVVKLLEKSELPMLPDSFSILADYVDEYQRYDAECETDVRRATAYSRVFQITQMLHIHIKETQKDLLIDNAVSKHRNNLKLLYIISSTPWITHKELSKELEISPPALTYKISLLEKEGFVINLRQGRQKHYFLTEQGETLKFKISQTIDSQPKSSLYSPEKEQLLFAFVKAVQALKIEDALNAVRQVIPYIETMDNQQVQKCLSTVNCILTMHQQNSSSYQRQEYSQTGLPFNTNYLPSASFIDHSNDDKTKTYAEYTRGFRKSERNMILYESPFIQIEDSTSWGECYATKY